MGSGRRYFPVWLFHGWDVSNCWHLAGIWLWDVWKALGSESVDNDLQVPPLIGVHLWKSTVTFETFILNFTARSFDIYLIFYLCSLC